MAISSLLALGLTVAGKAGFIKAFEKLAELALDSGLNIYSKAKGQKVKKIENIFKHMQQVRKVKTLWQVDTSVDISTFYCSSHVYIRKKRLPVESIAEFPNGNILIEGMAGQGKSIFLRYLTSVELVRGDFIPLFLELRRCNDGRTLSECLITALKEYELDIDIAKFPILCKSGL